MRKFQRHIPLLKKKRKQKKFYSQCRTVTSVAEAATRPTGLRFQKLQLLPLDQRWQPFGMSLLRAAHKDVWEPHHGLWAPGRRPGGEAATLHENWWSGLPRL